MYNQFTVINERNIQISETLLSQLLPVVALVKGTLVVQFTIAMGNTFSISHSLSLQGPDQQSIAFFRTIQVKHLKHFASSLESITKCSYDLNDSSRLITWREYFKIFTEIREKVATDQEIVKSANWNPCTIGYKMEKVPIEYEIPVVQIVEQTPVPDDYTEDEVSDVSGDEASESVSVTETGSKRKSSVTQNSSRKSSRVGDENTVNDDTIGNDSIMNGTKSSKSDNKDIRESSKSGSSSSSSYNSQSQSSASTAVVVSKKKGWDPNTVSPIFFGYGLTTIAAQQLIEKQEADNLIIKEKRAVLKAKSVRNTLIGSFEKSIETARNIRQKNIDELTRKYEVAESKRVEDIAKAEKTMHPTQFKLFKKNWAQDKEAAEDAYETEINALKVVHKMKSDQDNEALQKKLEELEAFKDVDQQEMPAAERLEDIARIEMGRLIDIIDHQSSQMDLIRREYCEIKEEAEALANKPSSKEKDKQLMQFKSMINVAETRVKEKQKELQSSLSDLTDAEVLLQRAVRVKKQQDLLLPLFRLMAREKTTASCRLDLLLCALTLYCSGTYDQKVDFFFELFSKNGLPSNSRPPTGAASRPSTANAAVGYSDCFNSDFLIKLVEVYHESFYRLNILIDPPILADIKNRMYRIFRSMELTLSTDLTHYEVKLLLRQFFSGSHLICTTLGTDPIDSMGTYQRMKMKVRLIFAFPTAIE